MGNFKESLREDNVYGICLDVVSYSSLVFVISILLLYSMNFAFVRCICVVSMFISGILLLLFSPVPLILRYWLYRKGLVWCILSLLTYIILGVCVVLGLTGHSFHGPIIKGIVPFFYLGLCISILVDIIYFAKSKLK